jgi:hypothetical protein
MLIASDGVLDNDLFALSITSLLSGLFQRVALKLDSLLSSNFIILSKELNILL